MKNKLIFIATGGNSLIKGRRLTTVEDQRRAVGQTIRHFAGGRRVVITAPEFMEKAILDGRGTHIAP